MTKKFITSSIVAGLVTSLAVVALAVSFAAAETSYLGQVVKIEGSDTLYYIASDGKRYVYPNENIYRSWFNDFTEVVTISQEDLAQYPLAGNILYRPGVILVKIQTDPKVYAVSKGGILRWIKTEKLAKKLYGESWAILIDDLAASFFTNYSVGQDINDDGDYDADEEISDIDTFEENRGLKLGHYKRANTIKCRAVPAEPARPKEGKKRATPAISARLCKLSQAGDATAPVISGIGATAATSTATISWVTDEPASSKVKYAKESLSATTTIQVVTDSTLILNHSLDLTALTPSTTYYFIIESRDVAGNKATSTEQMFVTGSAADTTAPVISGISVDAATSTATIHWTTNEAANSKVTYDDESLSTSTTILSVFNSSLVTSHFLNLLSLTPSTTYYFMVGSADASSNAATSSEQTFITDSE